MTTASDRLEDVQAALQSGEFGATAFGSPEHGRVVELLMCDHLGLSHEDGPVADARDSDGTPIQIKACRREHSNGGGQTVPGRWDAWSKTLIHLLADGGMYLLVVYDGTFEAAEVTPDDMGEYILAWRFLSAEEFGEKIGPDAWHDGSRPSKGEKARVFWTDVFAGVDA